MVEWIYLVLAILLEVLGTISVKKSQGFTNIVPSILIFVFYGLAFTCLTLAVKKIDVSIAYAFWTNSACVLIAILGIVWFKEPINTSKIISLGLIIVGVIGLALSNMSNLSAPIGNRSRPAPRTKVSPERWSYQPDRPGVAVDSGMYKRSVASRDQGELLHSFVPANKQSKQKDTDTLLPDIYRIFRLAEVKLKRFQLSTPKARAIADSSESLQGSSQYVHWLLDIKFEATDEQTQLILRQINNLTSDLILRNLHSSQAPIPTEPEGKSPSPTESFTTSFQLHVFKKVVQSR